MFFFLQLSGSKNLSEKSTHSGICKPGQFCKRRTDTDNSHKRWKPCVYLHDSFLLSCNSPESELQLVILISFSFFLCLIPTHFFLAKSLCLALLFQSPPFATSYLESAHYCQQLSRRSQIKPSPLYEQMRPLQLRVVNVLPEVHNQWKTANTRTQSSDSLLW